MSVNKFSYYRVPDKLQYDIQCSGNRYESVRQTEVIQLIKCCKGHGQIPYKIKHGNGGNGFHKCFVFQGTISTSLSFIFFLGGCKGGSFIL